MCDISITNIINMHTLIINYVNDTHTYIIIYIKTTTFSALQKYKRSHDNARANGSHSNASIVPFAVDTLGNFCSVVSCYYLFKSSR